MTDRLTSAQLRAHLGLPPPGQATGRSGYQKAQGTVKPQVRLPDLSGPNKGELAYMRILQHDFPGCEVKYEAISFRLGSGLYTPDLSVWSKALLILLVEVKAGWIHRDSSLSKFKEARAAWPDLNWRVAQRRKEGWTIAGN